MTRRPYSDSTLRGYRVLNVLYPYAGECWICGGPDKRHRLADSMIENVRAGDPPEMVAEIYSGGGVDFTVDAVNALVEYAAERTRQHRARWPK